MIVFDLQCSRRHQFEGWFRSSEDFARQQADGLLACPRCDCPAVGKAPMAPAVPAKRNGAGSAPDMPMSRAASMADDGDGHPERQGGPAAGFATALRRIAAAQAEALATSTWVGDAFAERTRAIHHGEAAAERIHGRASADEAAALLEEGVPILPLLVPLVPPDELN